MLVIGQTARVHARLNVGSLVVHGEVTGDITAQHCVELYAPAKVHGNISTPQLVITKGVIFEGTTHMGRAVNEPTLVCAPDKQSTPQSKGWFSHKQLTA